MKGRPRRRDLRTKCKKKKKPIKCEEFSIYVATNAKVVSTGGTLPKRKKKLGEKLEDVSLIII